MIRSHRSAGQTRNDRRLRHVAAELLDPGWYRGRSSCAIRTGARTAGSVTGNAARQGARTGPSLGRRSSSLARGPRAWIDRVFDRLGPGELEAIALAIEIGADRALIDDRAALAIANQLGVACLGTLAVLDLAAEKGLGTTSPHGSFRAWKDFVPCIATLDKEGSFNATNPVASRPKTGLKLLRACGIVRGMKATAVREQNVKVEDFGPCPGAVQGGKVERTR